MRSKDPFHLVHLVALGLCLVLLPWSTALLSMAQFLLVGNWIAGGIIRRDRGARWSRAFGPAPSLLFLGFFALHVVGLLWTSPEGMTWGLSLVRILLPVLVFTVVLSGSPRLQRNEFRVLMLLGAWSVLASTIASVALRGWDPDYRQISAFISHIRLALLLCLSVVVFLYYARGPFWWSALHAAAAVWCIFFITVLGSIQAAVILLVLAFVFLLRWSRRLSGMARTIVISAAFLPFVIAGIWLFVQIDARYFAHATSGERPAHSAGGETYMGDPTSTQRENGELVWDRIAWSELDRAWRRRSSIMLDSLDGRGHTLYPTLFRYMASKGLPKDSVGVMSLTDADIDRIEAGIPNHEWDGRNRLRDRFGEVMFELEEYIGQGKVSGHSLTMRLEFWKAGWNIFKRNWIIGVGTGDTQIEFDRQYELMDSALSEQWRLRAHNQYLTLLVSFGILGSLLSLFCVVQPARLLGAWRNVFFLSWAIIIGIGSLTDDTIETQAGATFFALYYALLVFAAPAAIIDRKDPASPETPRTARPAALHQP